MKKAPVALFAHRRAEHTSRTLDALARNPGIDATKLFVFCDGPRSESETPQTQAVRDLVRRYSAARDLEIVESENNLGLSASIVSGVTEILSRHESVIVLEDDIVTHPQFLEYMNFNLGAYAESDRVASIHGYVYPVHGLPDFFFLRGADCWGWATWRRGWDLFESDGSKLLSRLNASGLCHDFDFYGSYPYTKMLKNQIEGKNDSWAIRWYASCYLNDRLCLYPGSSLVVNIGTDQSGTHGGSGDTFHVDLSRRRVYDLRRVDEVEHVKARKAISRFFRSTGRRPPLTRRIRRILRRFIHRC